MGNAMLTYTRMNREHDVRAITVRELLGHVPFGLTLVAGADGLDRDVRWAHTIEVNDPAGWLGEGELVLNSGASFPASEAEQSAYLDGLAQAGASGLVLSIGTLASPLTETAVKRANELKMPLLTIAYEVSFSSIARFIANAQLESARDALESIHAVHQATLALAHEPASIDDTLKRLAAALTADLQVVDLARRTSLGGSQPDSPLDLDALYDAYSNHGNRMPSILRLPDRLTAVPVPARAAAALVAHAWAGRPPLAVLQHAAVTVAMAMQAVAAVRQIKRDRASLLISSYLMGATPCAQAMEGLAAVGLVEPPWVVLSASQRQIQRVRTSCVAAQMPVAWFTSQRGAELLLIPDTSCVHSIIKREIVAIDGVDAVGLSASVNDLAELETACVEAMLARRAVSGTGTDIRRYGSYQWSPLAPQTSSAAEAYVHLTLGPLLSQQTTKPWALPTLIAYLEHARSPSRTAAVLNIHRQTLVGRIATIERLLGLSLSTTGDLAKVWVALQLHDITGRESQNRQHSSVSNRRFHPAGVPTSANRARR